jgi:SAM-dependent methyltransferase/uncharacterized protein YbaR (Trm112 family)
VCRTEDKVFALRLAEVVRVHQEQILEGTLHCTNPLCFREFPIIDGIPVIIPNIRQFVAAQVESICARSDLSPLIESMIGDCCGPGSAFDLIRQQVSSYAWDHYGDLDPHEPAGEPRPGSMLRTLEAGRQLAAPFQPGPILDAGCGVGRSTFALAEASAELVLGVDLHFAMLRVAGRVLREGAVIYPKRRSGVVYERREFPARFANLEQVDFWCCDASALPLPGDVFGSAFAMNLLDCVQSPRHLLADLARVLQPGGKAVLACPYDWSSSATPIEAWLGGHSQRSSTGGAAEQVLRSLLTPGASPAAVPGFRLLAEREHLPWHVRLHDRSTMTYDVHLVVAGKG